MSSPKVSKCPWTRFKRAGVGYHALAVAGLLYTGYVFTKYIGYQIKSRRIVNMARQTLKDRNKPLINYDLSKIDVAHILSLDVEGLRKGLFAGEFTSVDLVSVYADRSQRIGRRLNLSAEENFNEAWTLAQEKDRERSLARDNGTLDDLPLLHGIPISIKDLFWQKGFLATVGCAFLCKDTDRADEDGVIVRLFRNAGAIPLVRGNVP